MFATKHLPTDCLPIIPDAEFAKVSANQMLDKVKEKYGTEPSVESTAYTKVASMFASSQNGGIGAPKNVTYWAWRSLTDEDETEQAKSEVRFVISTQELDAPLYNQDIDDLNAVLSHLDEGTGLTEDEKELCADCKTLAMKWVDVAVRTKSNRNGIKQAKAA